MEGTFSLTIINSSRTASAHYQSEVMKGFAELFMTEVYEVMCGYAECTKENTLGLQCLTAAVNCSCQKQSV